MNTDRRLSLLHDLQRISHREALDVSPIVTFLPLVWHRLALRSETVIVRGGRGSGKSSLFSLLQAFDDPGQLREFIDDDRLPDGLWLDAFSSEYRHHPKESILDQLGRDSEENLRPFWMGHLLQRLGQTSPAWQELIPTVVRDAFQTHGNDAIAWVPVVRAHLAEVSGALDKIERGLGDRLVFATYDHLDRIVSPDPDLRTRHVSSLLAFWLSLSDRYSRLRTKIFLREDLFTASEAMFPNVRKLRPRSVAIDWDVASLFRVTVRHMASVSQPLREWLRPIEGLELSQHPEFGWLVGEMSEATCKNFADRLAGELMGTGVNKTYSYRWIPNRLRDGRGEIVPRSILSLVGFAASAAKRRPLASGSQLLTPDDLRAAQEATSRQRVVEIQEEYPPVARIENLRDRQLLLDIDDTIRQLGKPLPGEGEGLTADGRQVFEELLRLGVFKEQDGRLDLPDLYRHGFGIQRTGGALRPGSRGAISDLPTRRGRQHQE